MTAIGTHLSAVLPEKSVPNRKAGVRSRRNQAVAFCIALLASAIPAFSAPDADPAAIIATRFTPFDDIRTSMNGTQYGLTTNLPGGKWVWGGGWNWGEPYVPATWDGATQNLANLAEEKTALGVSIASAGTYKKPATIHISADLSVTGNSDGGDGANSGGGLGFWSAMPDRDDTASSLTHFTGLNLMLNGDLQVYEDGTAVGTPVHAGTVAPGDFYNLCYDVNTTTGVISNVVFNGKAVAGLTSTAFKDAATAFAGVLSRQGPGVRVGVNNFAISSAAGQKQMAMDVKKIETK